MKWKGKFIKILLYDDRLIENFLQKSAFEQYLYAVSLLQIDLAILHFGVLT
jgi:hypothetical protein